MKKRSNEDAIDERVVAQAGDDSAWSKPVAVVRRDSRKTLPGRICVDPVVCGGRPHFKGTRIPVYVVLEMLSNQETWEDIRADYPLLTQADIHFALEYARNIAAMPRQSPVPMPA